MTCRRINCNFVKNGLFDYCCRSCSLNNGHGNQCTSHNNQNQGHSYQHSNNQTQVSGPKKCIRMGCNFVNNGYDYCCRSCSLNNGHGNQCTGNNNNQNQGHSYQHSSNQTQVSGPKKCIRIGCNFVNNGFDYCCRSCSLNNGHGNQCTGNNSGPRPSGNGEIRFYNKGQHTLA